MIASPLDQFLAHRKFQLQNDPNLVLASDPGSFQQAVIHLRLETKNDRMHLPVVCYNPLQIVVFVVVVVEVDRLLSFLLVQCANKL